MKDYILQRKIARVIAIIACRMGVTRQEALCEFYKSKVSEMLHNPATAMQLMSDGYIADEFMLAKSCAAEQAACSRHK